MAECVCLGARSIPDAVIVPTALNNLLVERLAEIPDEPSLNRRLFAFLSERASDDVFCLFISQHENILRRRAYGSSENLYDPRVRVRARALSFARLPADLRDEVGSDLEEALVDDADTSFLDDDDILALIRPSRLLRLPARIRDELLAKFPDMASDAADDADLDEEPDSGFDDLRSKLSALEEFFEGDETAIDLLSEANSAIEDAVASVIKKKKEREKERGFDEDDDWDWNRVAHPRAAVSPATQPRVFAGGKRSVFSDVDE